ncbi:MAG TPA: C39 family peptidase [Candidatus Paceibacterota bacterium]
MELLEIKPFQETLRAGMCGPASLKMVLDYFGIEKSEAELAELMGKTDIGTSAAGFMSAAEALGFEGEVQNNSSYEDIQTRIERNIPVIVNWFTRGRADYSDSEVADGHYSVVAGLDDQDIYLQDPEIGGLRKMRRQDFMRVWFDFEGECIKPDELIIRQFIAVYPRSWRSK